MKKADTHKSFYEVVKLGDTPKIYIYGYVGDKDWWDGEYDYTDATIVKEINKLCQTHNRVDIHLNSDGGSVKHGAAIVNAIRAHSSKIHTYNDGVSYSMTGEILFAPDKSNIHIADNALTMIHSASGYVYGNAEQLREQADYLEKLTNTNAKWLAAKFGISEADFIAKYYDGKDHFLTADELKEMGFDVIGSSEAIPDTLDKRNYQAVRAYFEAQRQSAPPKPSSKKSFLSIFKNKKHEPQQPASKQKEQQMTIEEIKAQALDNMSADELKALAQQKEDNKPLKKGDFKTLLKEALAEIAGEEKKVETPDEPELTEEQKQIKLLKEELEALKKSDGGTFTQPGGKKEGDEPVKLQPWEDPNHPINKHAYENGMKWQPSKN